MGLLVKIPVKRPLDSYGFPGEHVELWFGFPFAALQEYWDLKGDPALMAWISRMGVYLGSSFTDETGAPLAFDALPWDVQFAVARELMKSILERHSSVFASNGENGNGSATGAAPVAPAEVEEG